MPTLYLIDGHAQFFRAYHAIRPGMRSPVTDEPTNMTFGFVGMLLKLLREVKPEYLAVVIDASGDQGTFRSQIYPQYKANRDPPPEDMDPQIERCLAVLRQMRVPVLAVEGVEADDTIATIVRRMRREHPELAIRIVSRDKDLGQLVDAQTALYDPQAETVLGVEQLFESKGIRPDQVVDMLALMGDTVDNVPGVRGVGVKTAAKLIGQFGSLDALLANLEQVKGKIGEAIAAQRGILPLSRSLVQLKEDVQITFALEDATVDRARIDAPAVLEAMHQLGFNQHREQFRRYLGVPADSEVSAAAPTARPSPAVRAGAQRVAAPAELGLFNQAPEGGAAGLADGAATAADGTADASAADASALEAASAPSAAALVGEAMRAFERGDYRLLRTEEEVRAFVQQARAACATGALLAFDTETTSLEPVTTLLCGASFSYAPGRAVYIAMRSPDPQTHLPAAQALDLLRPLLEDPTLRKTAHNAKFDIIALRANGLRLRGLAGDSMVASYVVDATRGTHKMDALSEALLGHRCIPISELIGSGTHQRSFDAAPLALAAPYAAEDADIALRLANVLEPQMEHAGLGTLYREVEVPLVEVLAELEFNGIRVDPAELERQRTALEATIGVLRLEIELAAPRSFNIDSPRQLAQVLFDRTDADPPGLGLTVVKRTKTGASTDVEVLEKLTQDPSVTTPIPAKILEYRQLTKLVGTYLVALREAINPTTGRIHASFHQAVTATGRLSSSDPNLQNIPIRSEVGRSIRRAFIADPGNVLLCADYSQIELRVLAHLSQDQALMQAFHAGSDIHRAVAAEVYGVPPDAVSDEQRSAAKMVNFGIVYGITPFGLARRLGAGTSNERARQIIEDYKRRFQGIDAFLQQCVAQAREFGYVQTILGRRRAVPQVHSRNPNERALGERIAINTVVQGSAADLIKLAMLHLHRDLPARIPGARMLLQIHDELVFEVAQEQAAELDEFVRAGMESAMTLRVPLVASSSWGPTWAQ